MSDDDKMTEGSESVNGAFIDKPLSRVHKFYLSGEIKCPSEYIQWFEVIRSASENDVIVLHINSHGGDLFTAVQFLRVMHESRAPIVASVEGMCMSAATIIFLAAKHWEISKHSMFMFHNYSSASIGKGGEVYDSAMHERQWSENLWKDMYGGFLTANEIQSILHNKDIWMSGEEVTKRLITMAKVVAASEKKAVKAAKTSTKPKKSVAAKPVKPVKPAKKAPVTKKPVKKAPAKKA